MAKIYGPYNGGSTQLQPNQTVQLFWDVPSGIPDNWLHWMVTAVPWGVNPEFEVVPAEQRIDVIDLFFLRKGPDSTVPNQLQLNFKVRNLGKNPVHGNIIICAVGP
jgi:hypothetical protein